MSGYRDAYEQWLLMTAGDEREQAELRQLQADPAEMEDRFYRELSFGTAGMRGVLGLGTNRINRYTVGRVTLALAELIREHGAALAEKDECARRDGEQSACAEPGQSDGVQSARTDACAQPEANQGECARRDGASRGVVIAYDSRLFSREFARETALVLAARGVRAYLFDSLRPVPVLSFAVRYLHCQAGVVITASHNPSRYNGYKVYWEDGGQLPPERAARITGRLAGIAYGEARPMDEAEARARGLLLSVPRAVDESYIAAVKKLAVNPALAREMGDKIKIVYTPLHGSGNLPVRRILREIGMRQVFVVPEQEEPDGRFPTVRVPNPEEKDAFALAVSLQKQLGADLCVGTDPDCDRVGVACLTDAGEVRLLSGNQIGCVLLHYILSQKAALGTLGENAAVVKSIVTTEMARAICADFGVELFDVLTGFKFIAEMIQRFEDTGSHTFVFGFEESYGYLSGTDVRDKDGVNACLLIAEAACFYKKRGMTLVDAIEALYQKYGVFCEHTASVTLAGKDGLERSKRLMCGLRASPLAQIGGQRVLRARDYMKLEPRSDALYYELEDGWACVRPSGTEPKIKLYAGAAGATHAEAERLLKRIADDLKARMDGE